MPHRFDRPTLHHQLIQLSQSHWQGIPGVHCIDSGKPGPKLGLMAMTHGNEPAGLAAFAALLHNDTLQQHLQTGQVFLIVNNLKGGLRYFAEAEDLSYTPDFRYVHQDMNRLPDDLAQIHESQSYEIQRAQALLALYRELDYVLDIHSTSAPTDPMLIEIDPKLTPLNCPGVPVLLRDILPRLCGLPVVSLCSKAQGYVIEAGSHECASALDIAQLMAWRMLDFTQQLSHLPENIQNQFAQNTQDLEVYSVYDAVIFPDASYSLDKIYHAFEAVPAGKILAQGHGPPIQVNRQSYMIMPPPRLKPHHPGSEFFFLATKQRP